jgi:hypothetical protein
MANAIRLHGMSSRSRKKAVTYQEHILYSPPLDDYGQKMDEPHEAVSVLIRINRKRKSPRESTCSCVGDCGVVYSDCNKAANETVPGQVLCERYHALSFYHNSAKLSSESALEAVYFWHLPFRPVRACTSLNVVIAAAVRPRAWEQSMQRE